VKFLFVIKRCAVKTCVVTEIQLHAFLTWTLVGTVWLSSPLGAFTSEYRIPDIYWKGSGNSRASLNTVAKRKTPSLPEIELKPPVPSPALLPSPPYV
jgi:hypothetical protein